MTKRDTNMGTEWHLFCVHLCVCLKKYFAFALQQVCILSDHGKAQIMRFGQMMIKLMKRRYSFINRKRGKNVIKMLLFAFFVWSWCCDMLEQMIIMTAYEVFAYWSLSILVIRSPFSLYFHQTQKPRSLTFTVIALLLSTVVPALVVSGRSSPFYGHADSKGPWSDSDDLRLRSGEYSCTRWHSGLLWSQIKDGLEVEWHASTFVMKCMSYSSHWNLLFWSLCVFFHAFPCLYSMLKCYSAI